MNPTISECTEKSEINIKRRKIILNLFERKVKLK